MAEDETTRMIELGPEDAIHAVHHLPEGGAPTAVFLNSSGATTETWEAEIAPLFRAQGLGTLSFDYRGQGRSRFGPEARLDPDEIVADIGTVLDRLAPARPVLIGLSIGGLHAARAILGGARAERLVLINTLRRQNALVEWVNDLEARLIAMGGMPLVLDVLRPVLSGVEKLERLRPDHLPEGGYEPSSEDHPRRRIAEGVRRVDWDIPWERLRLPVLVMTGLHDRLFRIQEDVDALTARLPDATTVVYPDGGHSLQAEHPQRFAADVIGFATC